MTNKVTGIILAGGKSSRFGKDKSFVLFNGKPLIEILIDKLSSLFEDLMIITNRPRLYEKYKIRTETDLIKDCGPLGGIYTGLSTSNTRHNFFVACDMPFINSELIKYMCKNAYGYDVVVPKINNRYESLFAIYSKTCLKFIKLMLDKKIFKISKFFPKVVVREISENEVLSFVLPQEIFMNINTPEDLVKISNG